MSHIAKHKINFLIFESLKFKVCGIIGCISTENVRDILINGLERMTYRGYDSAGVAIKEGKEIRIFKVVGTVEGLKDKVKNVNGNMGIGHTRWATHGGVNEINAHPQCGKTTVIVHNGVIENIAEIRELLGEVEPKSETDTELIAHLLDKKIEEKGNLLDGLKEVMNILKGSYALGILTQNENRIYFAKKESPLLLGIGENLYIASDMAAFGEDVKEYIPLEDYDLGYLEKDHYHLENLKGDVDRKHLKFEGNLESVSKGGYEHYMKKEIFEEKYMVREMMAGRLPVNISDFKKIHVVGAGTSYNAGLLLKYLLEINRNIESDCVIASEYRSFKRPDDKTLIIDFSQSGETADTMAAVKYAKERNSKVLTITNIRGSTLDRLSDWRMYLNTGLEVGVAATKTFLSQMIQAYKIAGKEINKVPAIVRASFRDEYNIKRIAKELASAESMFYLGRGLMYPMAREGALKLKEITYIHAEAYPSGELKHGPLSLIEEDKFVVVLAPEDSMFEKHVSTIKEVQARGARVIALTDSKENIGDYKIEIPKVEDEMLYPFAAIVPLQLLAYYTAVEKGTDVDKPRNLAKSVTVE